MTAITPDRRLAPTGSPAAARRPLPLDAVVIDDAFWSPRRERIRTVTLRQQLAQLRADGHFDALRLTWTPGAEPEPHIFWESDVAKWIEAASYCLATVADPELDADVDEAIGLLAGAQQDDGYLNVYFTVVRPGARFTDLRDAHELYCAGHLIEAGVAHFQATGKTSLLDIVCRYADLLVHEFAPGSPREGGYDGHQEIELALMKLARVTGNTGYADTARRMIDNRGQRPFYFDEEEQRRGNPGYFAELFPQRPEQPQRYREYNQSHLPVVEQRNAVGHSVRAMYMYAAMTDIAVDFGDSALRAACERLWHSLTERKLYITGGLGSDHSIEGFAGDYDLPDEQSYAETCAAIGLVQWAQRMANATADGRYFDVLELALYNGVLSGASADGTHYFYGNPLASNGSVHRHEWFGVACCPPNLARLVSSLQYYIYSQGDNEAAVNLYVSGSATFTLDAGTVTLTQVVAEPGGGATVITVEPAEPGAFTVALRMPAWCRYPQVTINGQVEPGSSAVNGYLAITRTWQPGDRIDLALTMEAHRVWANRRVSSATEKVALQRGPFVYCLEGVDHDAPVTALSLPRQAVLTEQPDPTLQGCVALVGPAITAIDPDHGQTLYRDTPPEHIDTTMRAVPYFSWANRGQSTMTVWIHDR